MERIIESFEEFTSKNKKINEGSISFPGINFRKVNDEVTYFYTLYNYEDVEKAIDTISSELDMVFGDDWLDADYVENELPWDDTVGHPTTLIGMINKNINEYNVEFYSFITEGEYHGHILEWYYVVEDIRTGKYSYTGDYVDDRQVSMYIDETISEIEKIYFELSRPYKFESEYGDGGVGYGEVTRRK